MCPNCKRKVQVPEISIGDPFTSDQVDTPPSVDDSGDLTEEVAGTGSYSGAADAAVSASQQTASGSERVSVPRWIIYVQGALLGLTATTFFVFGMAVGNTTGTGGVAEDTGMCVISGAVYFDRGHERVADNGAVVILLPVDSRPRVRPDATGLRPDRFEAIRNEAIDEIRALGGCIVRADQDGNYQAELDNSKSYWWLVISRNQRADNDSIGKQTRAEMGTYFLPIEDLLGDQAFMWHKVRLSGNRQKMDVVTF